METETGTEREREREREGGRACAHQRAQSEAGSRDLHRRASVGGAKSEKVQEKVQTKKQLPGLPYLHRNTNNRSLPTLTDARKRRHEAKPPPPSSLAASHDCLCRNTKTQCTRRTNDHDQRTNDTHTHTHTHTHTATATATERKPKSARVS